MDAGRKRQLEFIGVYGSPENVRVSPSGLNLGGSMEKFDTPKVARLEMSEVIAERVVEEQVIEEQITEEQIIEDTIIEEEEIRFTMTSVTMVSEIKEVAGNGVTRGGLKLEAQKFWLSQETTVTGQNGKAEQNVHLTAVVMRRC